jgi:hypothetical protein
MAHVVWWKGRQHMADLHPHVIILTPGGHASSKTLTLAEMRAATTDQTQVGQTAHFVVYSDGTAPGNAAANAVLAGIEADYTQVQGWFGGLTLPPGQDGDDQSTVRTALPLHVLIDQQAGGAYHFGCDATDLYIQPDASVAVGLTIAELVEVFEAAQGKGWDCGHVNGEALSRVLATNVQPALGQLTQQTGQTWWSNGHADYVTSNSADDQNQDANGCGPLFLYFMHSQLGIAWDQIVAAGGATLGATYQSLTGNAPAAGFNDFLSRLQTLDSGGQISLPASGNPFPINATATPSPSGAANAGGTSRPVVAVLAGIGVVAILIVLLVLGVIPH